jgi:hypothetical protein
MIFTNFNWSGNLWEENDYPLRKKQEEGTSKTVSEKATENVST